MKLLDQTIQGMQGRLDELASGLSEKDVQRIRQHIEAGMDYFRVEVECEDIGARKRAAEYRGTEALSVKLILWSATKEKQNKLVDALLMAMSDFLTRGLLVIAA